MKFVLYALLAALFGTLTAFCCAYLTARGRGRLRKGLHLVSITSMAIPGIVPGFSCMIFFHGTPLYGTILILGVTPVLKGIVWLLRRRQAG